MEKQITDLKNSVGELLEINQNIADEVTRCYEAMNAIVNAAIEEMNRTIAEHSAYWRAVWQA